jgi:nitroreductase
MQQVSCAADKNYPENLMSLAMAVDNVIQSRKAIRCFLDKPVDKEIVTQILEVARSAPSNSNTQPWQVYVVAGQKKETLSQGIFATHQSTPNAYTAGFKHFPDTLEQQYSDRQAEFASLYYACLGIERSDQAARHAQTGRNFLFFGAPVGLIFTINDALERGSWIDYGIFLQTIMLAAKARGIDTCPQISFAKYHAVIRQHLPIPANEMVVCGMSVGYADPQAHVNSLPIPRKPVDSFSAFFGFD